METEHVLSIVPQLQGYLGWRLHGSSIVVTKAATNGNSDVIALKYSVLLTPEDN